MKTTEFVHASLDFYPQILKPSRKTKDSATIIDNIFVNLIGGKIKSGLLVTDVSDHLPVFAVLETNKSSTLGTRRTYNLVREKTPEAIMAFKAALSSHDWPDVYVKNANDSYKAFLDTFLAFYNMSTERTQANF